MNFLSETEVINFQRSRKSYSLTLDESLKNYNSESQLFKRTIFLSHKHEERDKLEGAIAFLKNFGIDVYVDWLDEGMPKTTSGDTAERLKMKIRQNDKFIFLATEAAIESKWCNWELGLGDAAKFLENLALLPVKKDYKDFSGSEYLQIYPYIINLDRSSYVKGQFKGMGAYVVFPEKNGSSRVITLTEWLRSK